ncbi:MULTISPECIES: PRC-barrel domain-containing protein [unclassified Sinorhizobium]|uniref:PRC-barrel domain-containing protein n=1 Tax=unclassified Sinorhizobium TaxID=2613772 RepID=UPI00352477F8
MTELYLQELLGTNVLGQNGEVIGRIEEVVAQADGDDLVVVEYHVGTFALLERFTSSSFARAVLRAVGGRSGEGLAVRWDQLDLSDPSSPKLLCDPSDLRPPRPERKEAF